MARLDITIEATDGFKLGATHFAPRKNHGPEVVTLIASATGVSRRYYQSYAEFLAGHGHQVVTFDYRGIGESRPITLNKFRAFMREWGEKDIAGVIAWLNERFPDTPMLLVGHSVAGQVLGLAHNNKRLSAALFVGSQSGYWALWPTPKKFVVAALWYGFIPVLSMLLAYFPASKLGLGQDLPAGVALEWASWGRDPNYLLGRNAPRSICNFEAVHAPLRFYHISDDTIAPLAAVEALAAFYPNAESEVIQIQPGDKGLNKLGHFGFFRDGVGNPWWPESVDWLNAHI